MPRIFDNISLPLLPALQDTLRLSQKADFCVGYFNLRGWKLIDSLIEPWPGDERGRCRLLVGMQPEPKEELRAALSLLHSEDEGIDQQTVIRLKKRMAEDFREQLTLGAPTNADEAGLRRLSAQLKAGKLAVKLFLRHPLHAKLYLLHRDDPNNPSIGFVGSSNLTLAGLSKQGELNVDVLDHDACEKLQRWFEDRWNDKRCIDISQELAEIIDTSWAREDAIPPFHIYLKIAWHLSQEAIEGLREFRIPRDFGNRLFGFQAAAVKIAAHHLNKRRGVLIGDVVGLGKTLMAVALARIFEDDQGTETLIICPKNLVAMWEDYAHAYRMRGAKVISISKAIRELPEMRRYRVVILDESHNLRNREGKKFKAIQDYIAKNESRCILLSATPYNKSFRDLSAQLRLFVPEDRDLGIRPEKQIKLMGETEFVRQHQCPLRSLAAFEKSEHADDWRELMRLYMVRRTRTFIQQHYAATDPSNGRKFLTLEDGSRSYFPTRVPKTIKFKIEDGSSEDPYARLYSADVVGAVNALTLPRYGLGNYVAPAKHDPPTNDEAKILDSLSRAGKRLMGFCRTNLFKRLESGGPAFLQSVERHIIRNFVFLHAIENGHKIPIGTQNAEYLDSGSFDEDADSALPGIFDSEDNGEDEENAPGDDSLLTPMLEEGEFRRKAAEVYKLYSGPHERRFKWLRPALFDKALKEELLADGRALIGVIRRCGTWNAAKDAKLGALLKLLTKTHSAEKVLIFTQFADTARYLSNQLKFKGLTAFEAVTGDTENPTDAAWRFSPVSNGKRDRVAPGEELRILIATDVLSEGQNLQDASIIVNYDLPWAIIRLVQRAGRVDRIGQKAEEIRCYSFLPADGIERIIRLRARVRQRLQENAEVVGTDESFFEDDARQPILDLYNEKSGILDGEADTEVDLASYAYQIWKDATDANPALLKTIPGLPDVVYSTRAHTPGPSAPHGALVYVRTGEGNDALAWIDEDGNQVTQSQLAILEAAACSPDEPAIPRHPRHHEMVAAGVKHLVEEEKSVGGQLGRPSGARFKIYERLKGYLSSLGAYRDMFVTDDFIRAVERALDEVYKNPLRQIAADAINRQLKLGADNEALARLVLRLRDEDQLCLSQEDAQRHEPRIICSMGLHGK